MAKGSPPRMGSPRMGSPRMGSPRMGSPVAHRPPRMLPRRLVRPPSLRPPLSLRQSPPLRFSMSCPWRAVASMRRMRPLYTPRLTPRPHSSSASPVVPGESGVKGTREKETTTAELQAISEREREIMTFVRDHDTAHGYELRRVAVKRSRAASERPRAQRGRESRFVLCTMH